MTRSIGPRAFVHAAAVLAAVALASGADTGAAAAEAFAIAAVRFEQNATDGDFEVVFDVKGGKDGLAELTILAPNGRKVAAFSAPEPVTLGMRQFRFESPEPVDVASLKAAYPEGEYIFSGKTFSGTTLAGRATLSHQLPPIATIVSPTLDAHGVPAGSLQVTWRAAAGLASCIVEIKQEDTGANVTARLPGSSTSFVPPKGFLAAGAKYKVAVGTVGLEGNISFVETRFSTVK